MRITNVTEITTLVGKVQKILSPMDEEIAFQGEIYISNMKTGVVNAWKKSEKMSQNLYILHGATWIVTAHKSNGSSFEMKSKYFQADVLQRVTIPKEVYYGFLPVGLTDCRILNILGSPYDAEKVTSLKTNEIVFDWAGLKK
jgi:hypothetical protein